MVVGSTIAAALFALPATAATVSPVPRLARAGVVAFPAAGGHDDYFSSASCTSGTF
jgi:hypothetical protein